MSNKDTKDSNKDVCRFTELEESAGIERKVVARPPFTRAMTVLILIFSHDGTDASAVERDKVQGTKENEGWKEKGEVSRDDEEAGEVGTRVKLKKG